jgi:hypothetical protein
MFSCKSYLQSRAVLCIAQQRVLVEEVRHPGVAVEILRLMDCWLFVS